LHQYAASDARIVVYSNNSSGIIPALRMALSQAKGSYITRMDADDIMPEKKLGLMLELLSQHGMGHVVIGLVEYFSDAELGDGYKKYAEWLNRLSIKEQNFDEIYKECVIPSPCWLVNRTDLENSGAFSSDYYPEDYDLCFRFKAAKLKVKAVKEVIHKWRDHPTRASRNDHNYLDNNFFHLKVHYFLSQEYDDSVALILWGAGKKGKAIAKLLSERNVSFRWICNNMNKIGLTIYNTLVESIQILGNETPTNVIVAVSNPDQQNEIKMQWGQNKQIKLFFFC